MTARNVTFFQNVHIKSTSSNDAVCHK